MDLTVNVPLSSDVTVESAPNCWPAALPESVESFSSSRPALSA